MFNAQSHHLLLKIYLNIEIISHRSIQLKYEVNQHIDKRLYIINMIIFIIIYNNIIHEYIIVLSEAV